MHVAYKQHARHALHEQDLATNIATSASKLHVPTVRRPYCCA